MRYRIYRIEEAESEHIETYITFSIATARQQKCVLIQLKFAHRPDEKTLRRAKSCLRQLKNDGAVEIYVFSQDFDANAAVINYFRDKFPEISEELPGADEAAVLVKI